MQITTVSMPPEVKKLLDERAGERPIYRMLLEEFLHEPDMQKLMEIRFDHLNERLDNLEKQFNLFREVQHEIHETQLKAFTELQDGIKQAFEGLIAQVNVVSKSLESRILQDEASLHQLVELIPVVSDLVKHTGVYDGKEG
jgi:hypothetical protein